MAIRLKKRFHNKKMIFGLLAGVVMVSSITHWLPLIFPEKVAALKSSGKESANWNTTPISEEELRRYPNRYKKKELENKEESV